METETLPAVRSRPPIPVPRTLEEQMAVGRAVLASGFAPVAYKRAEAVVVALQMGAELGLLPMQSLRLITVIQGKPTLSADGCAAVVMASGLADYLYTEACDATSCTVVTKRKGAPAPQKYTFTMEQAQRAGLPERSDTWRKYPERMLRARATSYICRDVYPDVVGGLLSAEEIVDLAEPTKVVMVHDQVYDQAKGPNGDDLFVEPGPPRDIVADAKALFLGAKERAVEDLTVIEAREAQEAELRQLVEAAGFTTADVCAKYAVEALSDLTDEQLNEALERARKPRKRR